MARRSIARLGKYTVTRPPPQVQRAVRGRGESLTGPRHVRHHHRAGICGLGTALLLARAAHEVTVNQRDPDRLPESPGGRGTLGNARASRSSSSPTTSCPACAIDPRGRPSRSSGVAGPPPGPRGRLLHPLPPFFADRAPSRRRELWTYTARRPAGEWVFANAAGTHPRDGPPWRRCDGAAHRRLPRGDPARRGRPDRQRGRAACRRRHRRDGPPLPGRRVAAASGRGRHEEQADCGFTYYTRYFRGTEPQRSDPCSRRSARSGFSPFLATTGRGR